jgi:hypothetical protein
LAHRPATSVGGKKRMILCSTKKKRILCSTFTYTPLHQIVLSKFLGKKKTKKKGFYAAPSPIHLCTR